MTTKTTYKYMITTTLLIIAALLIQSCNKPTEPAKESISVTVEDVSCTEAWLKINDTSANPNITVIVKRDDTDILTLNLNKADTVIIDESLLPNKTYTYRAVKQQGSNVVEASKPVTAVTLDTTSHNFTWQTFEFGEHGNSVLYDVAIIDENNIWAVGEIYMKDSLGNYDHNAYNAVHWDGQKWELKRINMLSDCNPVIYPPLRTIWAFDNKKMVVCSGGSIGWFDGIGNITDCSIRPLLTGSINKMWGSSSNDLYAVGNGGNIAHWDGSSWKKIESGTDVDILDVWGSPDGSIVWACGYYDNKPGTYLMRSVNKNFEIAYDGTSNRIRILTDTISGRIITAYTPNSKKVLIGTTSGVYNARANTKGEAKRISFTQGQFPGLPFRLRGTGLNDFIIVGEYCFIAHYNGYSWKYYDELWTDHTRLRSVAQMNNISVAVGSRYMSPIYSPAVIYMGRR